MSEAELSSLEPLETPRHGYRGETEVRPIGPVPQGLTLAISREVGARGGTIGRRVGQRLGWQVFDQEQIEHILQDGMFQQSMTDGLPATSLAWIEQQMEALKKQAGAEMTPELSNLGLLSFVLGVTGRVVLIGRGAGFLLPRATTLHVRLVAPVEERIAYMSQWLRLTVEEARQRVRQKDSRRAEFLAAHLNRQTGDACDYDLVLNTSCLGEEGCTALIVQALQIKEAHWRGERDEPAPR